MDHAAVGTELTEYHVEAAIAAAHVGAARAEDTPWATIVPLYDLLMTIRPSPVVALQRAIAIGEHEGPARGLDELAAIVDHERLDRYPFYEAAFGELELRLGRREVARAHFRVAMGLARSRSERRLLEQRMAACD
jgi:RNA polymerase sigma-70 factor (ECF subfamily)